MARSPAAARAVLQPEQPVNEVRLQGRWHGATERELPSGDVLVTARVVVARPEGGVDTLDCAVWPSGLRRKVLGWGDGVQVELSGSLRRRFWRTPGGPASRYEVHVSRIRRAGRRRAGRDASG
jgi:single-strand DNA-binding protein